MKFCFFFLVFLFGSLTVLSQNYTVSWGEIEFGGNPIKEILPLTGNNFLTFRAFKSRLTVSKHSNFTITATQKISTKLNGNVAFFEDVKTLNNQLVVFLSDRREGKDLFFMQKYDDNLKPIGTGIVLASYKLERGYSRGDFSVVSSQNKEYFSVIWNVPGKNNAQDKYGFKVYDKNLNEISEGEYKLPYLGRLSSINEHYLSNSGDYFISVTEYSEPQSKKLFKPYLNYKSLHLFHITSKFMEEFTIDLKGKRMETVTMNSDNYNLFTLTGVYGDANDNGALGLFYIRLNFETDSILNQGFEKFDKNFITQDWSDRQKEKATKTEAKGKGEPQLYSYHMRQTEVLPDGSYIGSMEQMYVQTNTYYDSRGNARNVNSYNYNDIITFKIEKNGGFEWLKKIDKQQVSINDGGHFSSYCSFTDGAKMVFLFNDNSENYSADGLFLSPSNGVLNPANFGVRKNVVALVSVDINNGAIERKIFFLREENEILAVPQLFQVDYEQKQIILYGINRRTERFGLLNFVVP